MTAMHITQRFIFTTGVVLATTLLGAAAAQQPVASAPPAQEQARERLQQITDRLQLTPEQTEQVRPVFVEEVQQLKTVRDKYTSDGGDQNRRTKMKMAREMRGIQQSTDDKLKKILTSKQMDEMKKLREEWRQQMRDRMARP